MLLSWSLSDETILSEIKHPEAPQSYRVYAQPILTYVSVEIWNRNRMVFAVPLIIFDNVSVLTGVGSEVVVSLAKVDIELVFEIIVSILEASVALNDFFLPPLDPLVCL